MMVLKSTCQDFRSLQAEHVDGQVFEGVRQRRSEKNTTMLDLGADFLMHISHRGISNYHVWFPKGIRCFLLLNWIY